MGRAKVDRDRADELWCCLLFSSEREGERGGLGNAGP